MCHLAFFKRQKDLSQMWWFLKKTNKPQKCKHLKIPTFFKTVITNGKKPLVINKTNKLKNVSHKQADWALFTETQLHADKNNIKWSEVGKFADIF